MSSLSLTQIRLYRQRASYSREALVEIFKAQPVAHVAFTHSGRGLQGEDGEARMRIMNLPLLTILAPYQGSIDGQDGPDASSNQPEEGELVVYLHM